MWSAYLATDDLYYATNLVGTNTWTAWETEATTEEILAGSIGIGWAVGIDRMKMEWLPHSAFLVSCILASSVLRRTSALPSP